MTLHDIAALVDQLSDRSGRTREKAREALVDIGPPAVPHLLPLASAPGKKLRWEVAKTLADIADPVAIPVLVERLSDQESGIRWLAAVGLINVGPAAIPAVLRALIADSLSTGLRRAAHHIFHDLGSEDSAIAGHLAPVLAALGDIEPADAIAPKAEEALHWFEPL